MISLAQFVLNLDRLAIAIETQNTIQERIALALERVSPALPPASKPYQSGIQDLIDASPEAVDRRAQARKDLAGTEVMTDSPAFRAKVLEYERQVGEVYGPEAIKELPWNK